MSSDRREDRKDRDRDREKASRPPNETNRNDSKSIRCRVFVGNLATENLSRQEFEDIFAKHGRVIGCSVHNGYGFVQYEKESSADEAVSKEHGAAIKGKTIDVNLAGDRRKPDKGRLPPPDGRDRRHPSDRPPRDRSSSPKIPGKRGADDPFAIPGYREARDRYRDEHSNSSDIRSRPGDPPYGRPGGRDMVPTKKLRPDYDFAPPPRDPIPPPFGKAVEAPIDCEIIIINKQQMAYAEGVEKKLKTHGLVVECAHLPETVPLLDELEDASKRGVLFGIIISSQHEVHQSVTVHILHGTQQEHRNMPLEDAILLVGRNFDTYMQALRERENSRDRGPPLAGDPHAPVKGYGTPGAVSSVVPSPYSREVSQLLNIAADGRPLTVDEYTLVIDEFTKIRNDLLKKEGRVPPSPAGPAFQPYPNDPQTIALQQAELQAKILSILNPTSAAKPSTIATSQAASVPNSKPPIPVLTPSYSASSAFKQAPAPTASQAPSSKIIGMALSSLRGGTSLSGILAPQSGTNPSKSGNHTPQGSNSYSGYGAPAGQSQQVWSQAQYRAPPVPSSAQSARPIASPGRGGYAGGHPGQMNSRGGYRGGNYPNYPPPPGRYFNS